MDCTYKALSVLPKDTLNWLFFLIPVILFLFNAYKFIIYMHSVLKWGLISKLMPDLVNLRSSLSAG